MFRVTTIAAEQIKNAAEVQDEDSALRVAAKIDDDGELVYGMGFDEERENDLVIQSEGITLLIAPRSQELLDQTTLDFVELRPGEFQFVFLNPKEGGCSSRTRTDSCGPCGGGCA
jgi:iron-sulfur cluster assembly protein